MGKSILKDVKLFLADKRINTSTNSVSLEYGADAPEATCFGQNTHTNLPGGCKTVSVGASGYFEAAEPDKTLFEAMGVGGKLITVAPTGIVGEVAYTLEAVLGEYTPIEGAVGDPAGFSMSAGAFDDLLRGILAQNGIELISDEGAGIELGTVTSGQKVYAAIHVFNSDGDGSQLLDVTIESDVDDIWGSPTTRLNFTQVGVGETSELVEVAGPITDTWWRAEWTVAGTGTPSFDFAVIIAIL